MFPFISQEFFYSDLLKFIIRKENKMSLFDNLLEEQKIKVWEKARIVPCFDPNKYRQDMAGAWIIFDHYGKTDNPLGYGWEIDHQKPISKGGSDSINNLQPLHWANNRSKADNYPSFETVVSSSGNKNIPQQKKWYY